MKKNIFSIIVIVLLAVNLVLTAIMMFAVLPNTTKTNELIAKVAAAIDLELAEEEEENEGEVSIYDLETYAFENDSLIVSLRKDEADKKERLAVIKGITIHMNTKVKDYDDIKAVVVANENKMKDIITTVYSKYTRDEAQLQKETIKAEILIMFEETFESKIVHDISFGYLAFQ